MTVDRSQIGPLFRARDFDALRTMSRSEPSWLEGAASRLLFDSAVRAVDFEAMQFVLDIGYDINEVSYTGTPLSRAASNGSVEAVQWLLDQGARVDESTLDTNPLFSAIQRGHVDVVRLLLAVGADPDRRYPCGRNALDFARIWNDPSVIALLGGAPDWKRPPWVLCRIPDLTGQKPSTKMLQAVERELGCHMPEQLKQFLLKELPEPLFFPDAKDNDDWIWLGQDSQLFHTARSMIAYNCENADQPEKMRKYREYFVIGTDGSGNDWCIRSSGRDRRVWSHDHETDEFTAEYESLNEFAEALQRDRGGTP